MMQNCLAAWEECHGGGVSKHEPQPALNRAGTGQCSPLPSSDAMDKCFFAEDFVGGEKRFFFLPRVATLCPDIV